MARGTTGTRIEGTGVAGGRAIDRQHLQVTLLSGKIQRRGPVPLAPLKVGAFFDLQGGAEEHGYGHD